MASSTLLSTSTSKPNVLSPIKPKITSTLPPFPPRHFRRRHFMSLAATFPMIASSSWLVPVSPASAESDEEYVKETKEVIVKVRSTIQLDRNDPNVATAVTELRNTSNYWVAKYRREKALLGRSSFRDIYSALNAVSGHYISFGPTAPIPAKRKARILEEMDTAEKALSRGR